MSWKLKFLIIYTFLEVCYAQKCTSVVDNRNVTQYISCNNVMSMNDIADEIKSNWLSLRIVNKATHTQFSNVAVNVPYLNLIQTLDLSCVGILNFTDIGFNNYDALRNLDISNVGLTTLKSSWFAKKNLETISLNRNALTELKRDQMKFFPKLRVFNASNNDLRHLEGNTFIDLKKLEVIALNNNHLPSVHFEQVESLKYLNLRNNLLPSIWGTLTKMPKLEILIVSENNINAINDRAFETLESLKYLNLSNNKLPHIGPWTFAGCEKTKLTELDLSFNSITIIYPVCFQDVPFLTYLDLSINKITEIHDKNFLKQTLLQTLYLTDNRIEKIQAKSFETLLQLRILDLSKNKLKTFTYEYFGSKFTGNKLRKLNLSNNELSTIDNALFSVLRNLVSLNLSSNKFQTLTAESFKNNINIQEFFLDDNQIEFLSPTFFKAFQNFIEEISIQNNKISFVPDLTNMKKLQKVAISNNPFQCICLREFVIWARTNKIKIISTKSNPKNPDCVVLSENTSCIKDETTIESYGMYDRFLDGMPFEENERADFSL